MSATAELVRPIRHYYSHSCGAVSKLPSTLALNLAKDPKCYAKMYCHACKTYLPAAEFTWSGGPTVGT